MWRKKEHSPPPPPPPELPELTRFDDACRRLETYETLAVDGTLADLRGDLARAIADRSRIRHVIATLNPELVRDELKAALRRRPDRTDDDTPLIRALRERYETANSLVNRLEELDRLIERTLIDVDTLVAQAAASSIMAGGAPIALDRQLTRLIEDAAALNESRLEVERL